ncbi:hypothetical protein SK128_005080 [Halocaridina rubra]|uniref:phosphoethanolamine N-methyltransferase n=1 Tax=Halocaridina rubra TaxID=373956 RepID=A0AAN8WU33_HALRR
MANEILSYLPCYKGKRILELGLTSSNFTESLAQEANHVTSVGVSQRNTDGAKNHNNHLKNVTYASVADGKLNFPASSFDVIISNTFFNDINNENEVLKIMEDSLTWLVPGGSYFLLEPSASLNQVPAKRTDVFTPRTHTQYCHLILRARSCKSNFHIYKGKNFLTLTDASKRQNHVCFVAQKEQNTELDGVGLAEMDIRYSQAFIHKLEWIFGHTWVSTGGEATTREFCGTLGLKPGLKVLDVGCGTGGSAFFMARHYGVQVHGVDISTNMINIALERLGHGESRVRSRIQFEIQDISDAEYKDDSYDVIYSRDCILHIQDKVKLFTKIHRWLKPGGLLFSTDYCRGAGQSSKEYLEYEKKSSSAFETVASYGSILKEIGFKDVEAKDLAERFYAIQKEELEAFIPTKEAFIQEYSLQEFEDLVKIASNKLPWVKTQQFTWGAFSARK